jgi:S-adenosylmethionine synthetase
MTYQFTSESVSEGHPDKVADAISDGVANYLLAEKDTNRAAVETMVTTNRVVLAGEYKTDRRVIPSEIVMLVRNIIKEIGYEQAGFHWADVDIQNFMHGQSSDIALGTDDFGAGDQGLMFGFATRETKAYMPAPIYYAHSILKELAYRRKNWSGVWSEFGPDAKSQVTFNYSEPGKPVSVETVVVSTQHTSTLAHGEINNLVQSVVKDVVPLRFLEETNYLINPTGQFIIGGPDGDAGLTGRKIIVDTYGGAAPHGGGAFSGKDGTKVDRTGAYMARHIAKNVLAETVYDTCQVQLSYAIGIKEPTSVTAWVDGAVNPAISKEITKKYDLTPKGMIEYLEPNKSKNLLGSTNYGHFGDKDVSWEKINGFV